MGNFDGRLAVVVAVEGEETVLTKDLRHLIDVGQGGQRVGSDPVAKRFAVISQRYNTNNNKKEQLSIDIRRRRRL